jgi:hypothetical protein
VERNPYLVLRLPFGASRDEANVAFARHARSLRRMGPPGKDRLVELTWALNQIDEAIADPNSAIDVYRIPADPSAFDPAGLGLFTPPPERMERRSDASGEDARAAIDQAVTELLNWTAETLSQVTGFPAP